MKFESPSIRFGGTGRGKGHSLHITQTMGTSIKKVRLKIDEPVTTTTFNINFAGIYSESCPVATLWGGTNKQICFYSSSGKRLSIQFMSVLHVILFILDHQILLNARLCAFEVSIKIGFICGCIGDASKIYVLKKMLRNI